MPFCARLDAQGQMFKGWPGHDDISDLRESFANPPKGYGNVPFYWWTGDPLEIERLNEQLDILSDASTDGLCVSYNHTHSQVDYELNAKGHGPCGRVSGGSPRVMSGEWWKIWNEFSANCAEKGVGLGMDDYVIAWPKNGEFIDSILAVPAIRDYQGALQTVKVKAGEPAPKNALTLMSSDPDGATYICTAPAPWLHPSLGSEIIDKYFEEFTRHMDAKALEGMNYFFQDELVYELNIRSWSEDMPAQFLKRKGYDIIPHLPALFIDKDSEVDAEAAKVRLDYAEVLTQLAEERYFKPIYDWNADKGLIYGCDPNSRGLRPTQYLDYFRAISWFSAPGNDAPSRGSSFRQTKVSSSIAHMYGRPRTWLEAFHSMGWDANGALLKTQLDHHIIAGGNLLCMHGLYYSTHGGWWEWAPPCFHFRMPYWPHMKLWLKYAERMCFLLSQGSHVCDVALLYPTETMQAFPNARPGSTFNASDQLSTHGLDYDFIDYQSLRKAEVGDGTFSVAGETYRVLVLVDAMAAHEETIEKILEFRNKGGIVITVGKTLDELSGTGIISLEDPAGLPGTIQGLITPDFHPESGEGRVLHRRIGDRDVYMVMNVKQGDNMFFRACGKAERWDAMDGSATPLESVSAAGGSIVRCDVEDGESMLVVFSPGQPEHTVANSSGKVVKETGLTGEWDISVLPTMNNKWGDFRLPACDEMIGVEARAMEYACGDSLLRNVYGFGPYMQTCEVDGSVDLNRFISGGMKDAGWRPYVWSWQYGVPDSPGSQGWHGLKSRVDDRFLILDKGAHQLFRTKVFAPASKRYLLISEGIAPARIIIDGKDVHPEGKDIRTCRIKLGKGWHDLLIAYASTKKTPYTLEGMRSVTVDRRDRGMVIVCPDGISLREPGMYDSIVASKWYGTGFLVYDIEGRDREWTYGFETAPGTFRMRFPVRGSVKDVSVDGKSAGFTEAGNEIIVNVPEPKPGISKVSVTGVPETGFPGAAFFAGPVRMECSGGRMEAGDWTEQGALEFYSGGMVYSRSFDVTDTDGRIVLDLGEVDATCEVSINHVKVKTLIGKPYKTDITAFVHPGSNTVEVLVYSSLSNHYLTTPSPYRGKAHAGLIGPVKVVYFEH